MIKALYLSALFFMAGNVVFAAPPKGKPEKPAASLSVSYRVVPNSELTEVYVVNNSRTKSITGKVALTKSYTLSMPDKTETVLVDLAPGEKVMVFHINQHYVTVRMDVVSAVFKD